jgi:hypothetical protein
MNLHFFLRITALLAIALTLFGCGKSASFRYKLTLAVNTPEGVKRSTSVTEWGFWEVSIPARGTPHKLRGEALYLDLALLWQILAIDWRNWIPESDFQ